eukprot:CAMPEP_0174754510 /NCGR_PEP_ID=MMETSP1094-20130205/105775_1 /TAXON_ID=156173 /ORGANISM="Chrysochromulina brevifilum, Strain UTEX LB 985" /LENGTH=573 /DNA_ID=CAMNT_0015960381 /DNA_START=33 /DNA_END=1754 /DNA_ORIENTATION=+
MSSVRSLVLAAWCLVAACAHRQFLDMIPNGREFDSVWPALGHVAPLPDAYKGAEGFPRNPFGLDFKAHGFQWTRELCEKDSDGDGLSNGMELGDPHCMWETGAPMPAFNGNLSHPGFARVGLRNAAAYWQHKSQNMSAFQAFQTEVSSVSMELFYVHWVIIPSLLVVALVLALLKCTGAVLPRLLPLCAATYLCCHVGTLIGSHRCYSHGQCTPTAVGNYFFGILESWALQGPATHWALYHRIHHRFCEQDIDLHSPLAPHDFWWAQGFWFLYPSKHVSIGSNQDIVIPDLLARLPSIQTDINAHLLLFVIELLLFISVSFFVSLYYRSCRASVLRAFCHVVYYFLLPASLGMNITMLVNSAVHLWGDMPYSDAMSPPCEAMNNAFLMFPMMGENWHNNHHGAPGNAANWVEWYQVDFQYLTMRLLGLLGLVKDIQLQPPSTYQEGYERLPFSSVFFSWLKMAAIVALPFIVSHLMNGKHSSARTSPLVSWIAGTSTKSVEAIEKSQLMTTEPLDGYNLDGKFSKGLVNGRKVLDADEVDELHLTEGEPMHGTLALNPADLAPADLAPESLKP